MAKGSALGNVFDHGNVIPFARGGIIGGPTIAPMAMMGEVGPEAVLPLARGRGGRLGVSAEGAARPVVVQVNTEPGLRTETTQDAQGNVRVDVRREIDRSVAEKLRDPGSASSGALRKTWGGRPALTPRG